MSVKFQITLPEGLAAQLRTEAKHRNVPLAQFIRETMEDALQKRANGTPSDPFAWMDGLAFESGETDISSRVDEIVYGKPPRIR